MRWKRRVLLTALAALVAWPIAHPFVVEALDLDPWRFCGFAMYATPSTYQRVYLIELRGDREVHLHPSWFSDDAKDRIQEYKRQRSVLGELLPPHEVAELVFAERPEIEGLKIVVQRDAISARTSRVTPEPATAFLYRR